MKKTTIYLVRHGESESNKQGIIAGHIDPDLTEEGEEQVRRTRGELRHIHFDEVYSSDLKRAVHTAEILYGRPVEESKRMHVLRERNFGSLEGKPEHHYHLSNRKRAELPEAEGLAYKPLPDVESDQELFGRFIPALEKIARNHPGETVLVVAHGGVIRASIMRLTGYGYKELPAGSFVNAGYAELVYDKEKGFEVIQINGVKL
jgi:broad specificity phosphatase PhoE